MGSNILLVIPVYFASHIDNVARIVRSAAELGVRPIVFCNSADAHGRSLELGMPCMAVHRNVGFGRAANLAASSTQFDWLIVCNDDCHVPAAQFAALVSLLNQLAADDIRVIGLLDHAGSYSGGFPGKLGVFTSVSLLGALSGRLMGSGGHRATAPGVAQAREMIALGSESYFPFVFTVISRACWSETVGFDPRFLLYYEDTDFLARVHRLTNHHVTVVPDAVDHVRSTSSGKTLAFTIPVLAQSAIDYLVLHTTARRNEARLIVLTALLIRLVLAPLANPPIREHVIGTLRAVAFLVGNKNAELAPWR